MKFFKKAFPIILLFSQLLANNYWQNYVHYNIDVKLNDARHVLDGQQTTTYFNNSPDTLNQICMLLYPNAYKNNNTHFARQQKLYGKEKFLNAEDHQRGYIDLMKLLVDGDPVKFNIPEDSISISFIELNKALLPGDSVTIETKWQVKIPYSFSRMCHSGQKYFISQWFPKIPVYDKKGWHPYPYLTIGEFYYEFGDYDVSITLPENYVVAATGELISPTSEYKFLDSLSQISGQVMKMNDREFTAWQDTWKNPASASKTKTLHYNAKNVVDFAWTASKEHLVQHRNFAYEGSTDSIGLWNFYLPENRKSWQYSLDIAAKTLETYGELCGHYPYPNVSVIDGDLTAGGGMEYPMLTIINSSSMQMQMWRVIAHEIGHNWFYGILGFNERKEAWMDEGLNTFGEMRFMDEQFPDSLSLLNNLPMSWVFKMLTSNFSQHETYQAFMFRAHRTNEIQASNLDGFMYENSMIYNTSVYIKPAMGFRLLESYVGKERFYGAMNIFYEEWKFKHPQPEDLQANLEKSLNVKLDWLFDDYLSTTNLPDYNITSFKKEKSGEEYFSTIKVENKGEASQPYDLVLYKNGKELDSNWVDGDSETITMKTSVKPDKAVISPKLHTIETNYYNNSSRLVPPMDFNFLLNVPTANRYMVNVIPYANYNYTEGIKMGGGLYHITPTFPQNTYYFYGTYSPKTEHINTNAYYLTLFEGEKNKYKITGSYGSDAFKNKIGGVLEFWEKGKTARDGMAIHANYMNLKSDDYLENRFWSAGEFVNFQFDKRSNSYEFRSKLNHSLDNNENYFKVSGTYHKYFDFGLKFLENKIVEHRFFGGVILGNYDNLPRQMRFFAAGGIDPDFEQFYMYDRTGETKLSPLHNYFVSEGVNLHGYQDHVDGSGNAGGNQWACGYNLHLESNLLFCFFDAGTVVSEKEDAKLLWDSGIGINLSVLQFHLPLYLNEPYDGFDNFSNWKALKNRWTVSLNMKKLHIFDK